MEILRDFVPEHAHIENEELLEKHGKKKIVSKFDGTKTLFPDARRRYRHVFSWVLLEDGSAVGWNESPRSGWGFPRIGKRSVGAFHSR